MKAYISSDTRAAVPPLSCWTVRRATDEFGASPLVCLCAREPCRAGNRSVVNNVCDALLCFTPVTFTTPISVLDNTINDGKFFLREAESHVIWLLILFIYVASEIFFDFCYGHQWISLNWTDKNHCHQNRKNYSFRFQWAQFGFFLFFKLHLQSL